MDDDSKVEMVLKAISNKKRLEILDYIQEEKFLIKGELIERFGLQRAGLDFHLAALEEAGLIGTVETKIKGRKYVHVYPKARWKIALEKVDAAMIPELLVDEITEENFAELAEKTWKGSSDVKDVQIIKKVLESLVRKLDNELEVYRCQRCGFEPGIIKCSGCGKLFCTDCAELIRKSEGGMISLCYDCIADEFS